jgi:hypothetical protein
MDFLVGRIARTLRVTDLRAGAPLQRAEFPIGTRYNGRQRS